MSVQPGQRFDRYSIEELVGEGGMGRVYRAYDTRLQRRVAIKVLHCVGGDAAEAVAIALREARAAAGIAHPNATAVYDAHEVEGTSFIVMELVAGTSLRAHIDEDPPPSLPVRLRWLIDVAAALAAAHRMGVVHRDVKPENVMVRNDGLVKVLDFGVARCTVLEATSHDGPTSATYPSGARIVGTPAYMSPEQIRGEPIDGRADQFGWAVLAYELLAGRLPWRTAKDPIAFIAAVVTEDPAPLASLVPDLPPPVAAAIHRALSKNPAARFPSMLAAATELAPYARASLNMPVLDDMPAASSPAPLSAAPRPDPEPARPAPDATPPKPAAIAPAFTTATSPPTPADDLASGPPVALPTPERAPAATTLPNLAPPPSSPTSPRVPFSEYRLRGGLPPTPPRPSRPQTPPLPLPMPGYDGTPKPPSSGATVRSLPPKPAPDPAPPAHDHPTPKSLEPLLPSSLRFSSLRSPDFEAPIDLEAHLALLPPEATCKGFLCIDVLQQVARIALERDVVHAAQIPERRYVAFRDYPLADHMRLAVAAVRVLYPRYTPGEGLRRLGQTTFDAVLGTHLGRSLFGILGRDVEPVLLTGPKAFKLVVNVGQVTAEKTGARTYVFRAAALPAFLETYQVGVLEGVLRHCGEHGKVRIAMQDLGAAMLEVTLV